MTPRIRPTMQDYRDAQDYRWLQENPDLVLHVGGGMYAVFHSDLERDTRPQYARVKGLGKAIEVAAKVGESPF